MAPRWIGRLKHPAFWDLVGQALTLLTSELRAILATTVDLVFHALFTDPK